MSKKIKIDIVSDVMCPWCIIGYRRLDAAIKALDAEDQVEIEWQPFQLNPDIPPEGEEMYAHLQRKYGTSKEDADKFIADISKLGAELGFTFDYFEGIKAVNTLDVHVLLDYAKTLGKQTELKNRLFAALYSERKDVSDREVLIEELRSLGIDVEAALKSLDNKMHRNSVLSREQHWKQLGISGVPTVIFNQESAITGAESVDVYKQALSDFLKAESE